MQDHSSARQAIEKIITSIDDKADEINSGEPLPAGFWKAAFCQVSIAVRELEDRIKRLEQNGR